MHSNTYEGGTRALIFRLLRSKVALRYLGALFCAISSHRCRTKSLEMWRNVSILQINQ